MNKINLLLMKNVSFSKSLRREQILIISSFLTLNFQVLLYFLKLCQIFVDPKLCQLSKYKKDILLVNHFCYKIEAILYPRVSYSITKLKLLNTNSAQRDNDYSVALLKKKVSLTNNERYFIEVICFLAIMLWTLKKSSLILSSPRL